MRHLILFLHAAAASAQIVSVGVKAGVPVTPALRSYYATPTALLDTGRWTIGPTVELRLVHGFSAEADAVYRGYRQQESFATQQFLADGVTFAPTFTSYHWDNKVWDFNALLKYRFGSRSYRPFVDGGYTWSHRTSDVTSLRTCLGSADACSKLSFGSLSYIRSHANPSSNSGGPTAGVGVEFKHRKVKIAPEVRYTHLSTPTASLATVMLGVTF